MFNAYEAMRMSKENSIKNTIREDLNNALDAAIQNGAFECTVNLPDNTPVEMINDLIDELKSGSFIVQNFAQCDTGKYIKIFWNLEE